MESVEIHGPAEVYLGDNITLECVTGESFPGEKSFSILKQRYAINRDHLPLSRVPEIGGAGG